MIRRLLLMRHATAEDFRPGFHDRDRRLTERGRSEAVGVGDWLREQEIGIDLVLCSAAVRTRQTLDALDLTAPIDYSEAIYSGGSDTIIDTVRELEDSVGTALLVGHSPAVPSAVQELADPEESDPAAMIMIERGYPPATLAVLEISGSWADLTTAGLVLVRVGR